MPGGEGLGLIPDALLEHPRVGFFGLGDRGGDTLVHQLEELGPDAEGAAVPEVHLGMLYPLPDERGRDVVLSVAGREQHQRDGRDVPGPTLRQAVHALRDRGPRELDEPALHRKTRVPLPDQPDELVELLYPPRVAGAVANHQERRPLPAAPVLPLDANGLPHVPPQSRQARSTPQPRPRTHPWAPGSPHPAGRSATGHPSTPPPRRSRPETPRRAPDECPFPAARRAPSARSRRPRRPRARPLPPRAGTPPRTA